MFRGLGLILCLFFFSLSFLEASDPGECTIKDGSTLMLPNGIDGQCKFQICGMKDGWMPCKSQKEGKKYCYPSNLITKYDKAGGICSQDECVQVNEVACRYGNMAFCLTDDEYRGWDEKTGQCLAKNCEDNLVPVQLHQSSSEMTCVKPELLENKAKSGSFTFSGCQRQTVRCGNLCVDSGSVVTYKDEECSMKGCPDNPNSFPCEVGDITLCVPIPLIKSVKDDPKECTLKENPFCPGIRGIPCDYGGKYPMCVPLAQMHGLSMSNGNLTCRIKGCADNKVKCSGNCTSMDGLESVNEKGICKKLTGVDDEEDSDNSTSNTVGTVLLVLLCVVAGCCCCAMLIFVIAAIVSPKGRRLRKFWMKVFRLWTEKDEEEEGMNAYLEKNFPSKAKNEAGKEQATTPQSTADKPTTPIAEPKP